jgi:zinc protease
MCGMRTGPVRGGCVFRGETFQDMKGDLMRVIAYSMILLAVCAVIVSCANVRGGSRPAAGAPVSPIEPFTRTTLKNGLEVIVKEVHSAPIVAVYLWCNTGSINEDERVEGISHFYEHMFFKGTEKRGVGEIDRTIKSLGGYNNAFTSKEYTAYYVVLPSENFSLAADVLVDAICNSKFPADEIQKELGVIKEEINRKDDDPAGTLSEEIFSVMFPGTRYAHSVLGTRESVSKITRDDFKNYLSSYYVPNNITAVVVGDVRAGDAVKEFERLTAGWNPNPGVEQRRADVKMLKREGIQGFTIEKDVNMSYVMMAFLTSGLADQRENAVMDVASTLLGEGRSSRLYKRIVEKDQIAMSVSASIYPLSHAGLFIVTGTMDRENVNRFRDAVLDEIGKLRSDRPVDGELTKAKTMLKADFAFSNETGSDIASTLGYYTVSGILDRVTQYERIVDSVTQDEVRDYSKKILDPESYSIGIINQRIPGDREVGGEK